MSGRKLNFCRKFAIETFPATVANADTESLESLHTLFNIYLDHMLAKFETFRIVQNVQNFEHFDKKSSFLKPFSTNTLTLF